MSVKPSTSRSLPLFVTIVTASLLQASSAHAERVVRQLSKDWEYRQADKYDWSEATVPGCVHTDLLNDKRIDDPSFRLNEQSQQWVGHADWEYRTTFEVDERLHSKEHKLLCFHGLDTFADVYLNGRLLLSANNMFRTWKVDCRDQLRLGSNELRVHFHDVFSRTLPEYEKAPFVRQAYANNDQARVRLNLYARKAGFHFGWDWGPRLITCGIWRPVTLEAWDDVVIEDVFYEQTSVDSDRAEVTAHVRVKASAAGPTRIRVRHGETVLVSDECVTVPGEQVFQLKFVVEDPELWWTHDLGEPTLYEFAVEVFRKGHIVDSETTSIGLRELRVVRERDEHGKAMRIVLNGVPLFIKGANYIPQDNFQSRVSHGDYRTLIDAACDSHMNMLRVWGGGIYEQDEFYDLCDREGLLVWQDIMFACGMYPADEAFLDNVRAEVIDNVRRLRNRACLALYCGNNEVEIAWHEWGWKEKYSEKEQQVYQSDLDLLFYKTIPEAIKQADPTRYYHPSSPITGYSERGNYEGDVHYWGVWHSGEPFEEFQENVGRFMSEYGFQSYPGIDTVRRYASPEDLSLDSEVMHAHQRSRGEEGTDLEYGNKLIQRYLKRYFPVPEAFDDYLTATQLLQAYGVTTAIESHRRRKPYCSGTLYWQLNDCWPVASWSSIDYYGQWKASQYAVKRAYAETIIPTVQRGETVEVYVASDRLGDEIDCELRLTLLDFSGKSVWEQARNVVVTGHEGRLVSTLSMQELPDVPMDAHVLAIELIHDDRTLAEKTHGFVYPRDLKLNDPKITSRIEQVGGTTEVVLHSANYASYVHLKMPVEGRFSDNYFDMLPDREYRVIFVPESKSDVPGTDIDVRSLYDLRPSLLTSHLGGGSDSESDRVQR